MNKPELSILEKLESALHTQTNGGLFVFMKRAQKPILLLSGALLVGTFFLYNSLSLLLGANQQEVRDVTRLVKKSENTSNYIFVDLSGSVNHPNTYKLKGGARLFELIDLAGGLSPEADNGFVQRNYNFAVILNDQQKIHIPSVYEVRDGIYNERNKLVTLDAKLVSSADTGSTTSNGETQSSFISLNSSTLEEIKLLPGVGDIIGQQIIAARPYTEVNDLLEKGIVKQSLYDKIVHMLEP